MIVISFTKALPLFTIVLACIYLALLILSERTSKEDTERVKEPSKSLILLALVLTIISFALLHIPDYKLTTQYRALVALTYATLLIIVAFHRNIPDKYSKYFLFLAIIAHLLIVYNPPYGMYFGEWTRTITKIVKEGYYEIEPYRFTYNPFPFHAGLWAIFSEVTGISIISKVSKYFPALITLIVIDLVLYALAKRLTGNCIVGIIAILLLASTPPANFLDHNAKLAGLMLVLIMTLALTRAYEGCNILNNGIIACLAYASGIFYHATAGLGMFIIAGIMCYGLFMHIITNSNMWRRLYENKVSKILLIVTVVFALVKWMWGGGAEKIIPSLYRNFLAMIEWKPCENMPPPLYVRKGVNPIQAYPWSLPVAASIALLIYVLLKRRHISSVTSNNNELIPALAVGGLVFLLIGFSSAYFRTGFAASMYPGYDPLMLSAAVVLHKLLSSRRLAILAFAIVLLTTSVVIALKDPMNLPGGFLRLKHFIAPGEEQYMLVSTLCRFSTPGYNKYITRELGPPLSYLSPYTQVEIVVCEPTDPKYQKGCQIIRRGLEPNTIYILRLDQICYILKLEGVHQCSLNGQLGNTYVNVFLNNGNYLGLMRAGKV